MPLAPGATIGAYRIIESIGSGGMGEVFRAHDSRLGRDVALKILPAAMAADDAHRARFEREARAVAALNHPHIVTIYSTEQDGGVRFLTMELVEGRTLDQLIPPGGVEMHQFFDIAIALADALCAAHAKHIIHRDLKPSNVMVTTDGRVKVLDFGLASAAAAPDTDHEITRPGLTQAGMLIGTVPYMSPEQVEGKPVDHRSDLFSLGIVLYEMAGGRRPFTGDSSAALMSSILRDDPPPLSDTRPAVPAGVARLISACLQKSTRDRVQDAREVLAELKTARKVFESGRIDHPAKAGHLDARISSIAVLPFADMSAAQDQGWFCDGIAEEILNALTPLQGLKVAARASAFSFRGRNHELAAIAEKLHVTTVLDGSVRRAGNRVRITVQLNQVGDGFQMWSERYDREIADIFDVQDEIARAVAERLRVTLTGTTESRLVPKATANVDAYQHYLKGRGLLYKRGPSIPLALEQFQKAVELDPDYTLAWAGIADTFTVFGYYGAARPENVREHALEAAARAIALDEHSAEARTALACALLFYRGDPRGAEREFRRALELNPHYVQGRCWYALFLLQWTYGRFEEGLAEAQRALASDPLSSYAMTIASLALALAGRADDAIAMGRRALDADPHSYLAHWGYGQACAWGGHLADAVTAHRAGLEMSRTAFGHAPLAVVLARVGQTAEALAVHQQLLALAALEYQSPAQLAMCAAAVGRRDEALAFAAQAWQVRDPFLYFARHYPDYGALRAEPAFQAILREMDAQADAATS